MKLTQEDLTSLRMPLQEQILKNQEDAEKWNDLAKTFVNYHHINYSIIMKDFSKYFKIVERLKKRIDEIKPEKEANYEWKIAYQFAKNELQRILEKKE